MPISNRSVFLRWSTSNGVTSRTAVYGPVRTVVWQGSVGNRCPYADQTRKPRVWRAESSTCCRVGMMEPSRRHSAETLPCHSTLDCCYAFLVTLNEHLDRADAATRAAWEAIEGPFTLKDTRSQLFLAYASIALEHQEAITLLIRHGLRGSAVALIRPIFEIFYRAAWIHHCAKLNQIEKIKKGKFRFPEMGAMVNGIDKAMGETFFQNFKANSWKDQNDFTHSGRMQVNSRLTRDDLQSAYPDEMIAVNLATTTMVAILVTV